MNKLIFLILVAIGLMLVGWGISLVHHNYVHQRDVVYLLKAGIEELPIDVKRFHSEQATKDILVHLGLIIFGTSIATYVISKKSNI